MTEKAILTVNVYFFDMMIVIEIYIVKYFNGQSRIEGLKLL